MTELLLSGPRRARWTFAYAHGAGAPMDHPFMQTVVEGVARANIRVARFEFPYMAARRTGGRRGPDRQPVLLETWRDVITALGHAERLVIGGKSMGGRMASMVADEAGVAGLVCHGYPFHPPGKPGSLRVEHLKALRTPALIVQGERDAFGARDEARGYRLSKAIRVHWLADGDHSFTPRKSSGRTSEENLVEAVDVTVEFIRGLASAAR